MPLSVCFVYRNELDEINNRVTYQVYDGEWLLLETYSLSRVNRLLALGKSFNRSSVPSYELFIPFAFDIILLSYV